MWSDRLITDSQFVSPRKYHKASCVFVFVPSLALPPFWHSFPLPRYARPSHCLSSSVHILYGFFQFIYILHCLLLVRGRLFGSDNFRSNDMLEFFYFIFVSLYHILLYLSNFTNDTNCKGFREKTDFWGLRSQIWFIYIYPCMPMLMWICEGLACVFWPWRYTTGHLYRPSAPSKLPWGAPGASQCSGPLAQISHS